MHMASELTSERIRSQLELAERSRWGRRHRALSRARRTERKAERRLIEARRARNALEATLGEATLGIR
jgi:hypothetical protein